MRRCNPYVQHTAQKFVRILLKGRLYVPRVPKLDNLNNNVTAKLEVIPMSRIVMPSDRTTALIIRLSPTCNVEVVNTKHIGNKYRKRTTRRLRERNVSSATPLSGR